MAHFSGGTGTPEDNVGYSFHDTVADEIFKGALLRGESPLVALHELENVQILWQYGLPSMAQMNLPQI